MAAFPGSDAGVVSSDQLVLRAAIAAYLGRCRAGSRTSTPRPAAAAAAGSGAPGVGAAPPQALRRTDQALRKTTDRDRHRTLDENDQTQTKPAHVGQRAPDLPGSGPQTGADVGRLRQGTGQAANLCGEIDRSTTPRWWMAGTDARSHFDGRATGRRPGDGRGGDTFTGRMRALKRVREWLQSSEGPGFPLVVTGQAGAGKSSVLARARPRSGEEGRPTGVGLSCPRCHACRSDRSGRCRCRRSVDQRPGIVTV